MADVDWRYNIKQPRAQKLDSFKKKIVDFTPAIYVEVMKIKLYCTFDIKMF